jgi:hypothetical protein
MYAQKITAAMRGVRRRNLITLGYTEKVIEKG